MTKPVILINADNLKSFTKYIGKQTCINREIISYLDQLSINGISEVGKYHLQEIKRLVKEQGDIEWQVE